MEELEDEIENHIPGSTTDLGEGELDTPDLTLVSKTILPNKLKLRVTKCFVRSVT